MLLACVLYQMKQESVRIRTNSCFLGADGKDECLGVLKCVACDSYQNASG